MLTVTDTIKINADLGRVFDCFWNPEYWPRLTDHVKGIDMLDSHETRQRFKMLVESNGKQFLMESERECVLDTSITYVQTQPPPFLRRHTGRWDFVADGDGVSVTLTHDVVIDEEKALELLPVSTVEEAKRMIGENLKRNGSLTMNAVKRYLETAAIPASV
jgi:aromatase